MSRRSRSPDRQKPQQQVSTVTTTVFLRIAFIAPILSFAVSSIPQLVSMSRVNSAWREAVTRGWLPRSVSEFLLKKRGVLYEILLRTSSIWSSKRKKCMFLWLFENLALYDCEKVVLDALQANNINAATFLLQFICESDKVSLTNGMLCRWFGLPIFCSEKKAINKFLTRGLTKPERIEWDHEGREPPALFDLFAMRGGDLPAAVEKLLECPSYRDRAILWATPNAKHDNLVSRIFAGVNSKVPAEEDILHDVKIAFVKAHYRDERDEDFDSDFDEGCLESDDECIDEEKSVELAALAESKYAQAQKEARDELQQILIVLSKQVAGYPDKAREFLACLDQCKDDNLVEVVKAAMCF